MEYWAGICPGCRLTIQVEFVEESAAFLPEEARQDGVDSTQSFSHLKSMNLPFAC